MFTLLESKPIRLRQK